MPATPTSPLPTRAPERPSLGLDRIADLVGARSLWERGITGSGVAVAVIDTGVADVDALDGRVIARVDLSVDQTDPEVIHHDQHGHGTHLAGIVAATAPEAPIVAVKVAGRDGHVDAPALLTGIEWVIAHADDLGIRVINLAFSAIDADPIVEQALHSAVERAWDAGIVVVTAAGNEGADADGLVAPASNPLVLSVGSVTVDGDRIEASEFTSRGDHRRLPDLAAPGAHVQSLRAPDSDADCEHPEGYVDERHFLASGSSQAAAVVAGIAAMFLHDRPQATPDQVKLALIAAAAPVLGATDRIGAGLVSAPAACVAPLSAETQTTERTELVAAPPAVAHIEINAAGNTWTGVSWAGVSWAGVSWAGNTWTGVSWAGVSWAGNTWTGVSWAGVSWAGVSWAGVSWAGNSWTGVSWAGVSWA